MKVLILAGGFATRLWPLTEHRAKPLLLLDGKTILEHILDKVPPHAEVFILTNSRFQKDFQQLLTRLQRPKTDLWIEDAHSDIQKMGAMRALACAITDLQIHEPIWICAGDNILTDLDLMGLTSPPNSATISVREVATLEEARRFGVVQLDGERVVDFEEKPASPKSRWVSTGFFELDEALLEPLQRFAEQNPDNLGGMFGAFLEGGATVYAQKSQGSWFDVGSFDTYLEAHMTLQSVQTLRGKYTTESLNRFSGKVFIGDNATVQNCQLSDCIIYPGATLRDCHLSQVVVDTHANLHGLDLNRKLVRAGTTLHSITP